MAFRSFVFTILVCVRFFAVGQSNTASEPVELTTQRGFLDTKVLKNGIRLSPSQTKKLFYNDRSFVSMRKYNFSKYLLYAGIPSVAGGSYLAYDAIKGTRMSIVENGQTLVYYKRPIFQLMGGIALFTVGVCLIEYNNEFKRTAVTIYNNKVKDTKKAKDFNLKAGVSPSGNMGLYASF
jgi:hypothetical protein